MSSIAVNHAALLAGLSPYNWYLNGSASICTVNAATFKLNFTGTSFGIVVDVSGMSSQGYGGGYYPVAKWSVDGGATATRQFTSSDTSVTLVSGLADATHSIVFELMAFDESGNTDRWTTPYMKLMITSLTVDTGKTITPATKRNAGYMLAFGDSITEGAVTISALGGLQYAQVGDATRSYSRILADALDLEYGNCSFSGQGWTTGVSNVPGLSTAYASLWNGVPRSFSPAPNVVTVCMGTNGSVVAATVTTFLTNLRAAVGPGSRIHVIIPPNQSNVSAITTGVSDYQTANTSDKFVTLIDGGSTVSSLVTANSYDSVHPNTAGQIAIAAVFAPYVKSPLSAGAPPGTFSPAF